MIRVAVYGGSFNPPHVGHAMVTAWLRWTDRVDEVWLLPTFEHAFGKALLPFELRVQCCEALATAVGPWVRVEPIESQLPVPSYTIDTLEALSREHPRHHFRVVVGADILPETPRWKAWDAIEESFPPIVVGRGGYPPIPGVPSFPEISSTEIRAAIVRGDPVDRMLPAAVCEVLEAHSAAELLRSRQ